MMDSCLFWTYESGRRRMYSRQQSTGNRPSPVCTRGGTVMVPLAKRLPLFAHLCNEHGRSARRSISTVRWRRCNQFLRRMATLDRLSAALYSRPWKASRCALVNKEKWIKCSYVFPGLAPSKLLLGIGSTGLQLKLFPALQGGLHFYDPQIIQHVQERRTSSRKLELCDLLFLTVHVSRVTLEGRHNALKNGSSSTFLWAWSKRLNLKRRNQRRRGRRRGGRTRRRRKQRIKALPVQREGTKERTWHWQLNKAMTAQAKMMRTSRSWRLWNRTVE